ncbi:hypothetical protein PIB30_079499 [Stylosanthes scabra]|uniref:Uncharacterized protein n=1 Tax=Stylosanthes scabra TaxID=79078 RepID=A0ABU6RRC8_9FABA|nr:hypothetical protein [Stylosanthes scabra]
MKEDPKEDPVEAPQVARIRVVHGSDRIRIPAVKSTIRNPILKVRILSDPQSYRIGYDPIRTGGGSVNTEHQFTIHATFSRVFLRRRQHPPCLPPQVLTPTIDAHRSSVIAGPPISFVVAAINPPSMSPLVADHRSLSRHRRRRRLSGPGHR